MSARVEAGGFVAPGFEPVRDAFERNFAEHGELGAAFAAVRDGESVVDLWGGVADSASGRPWREDTIVTIFSGTKGLVAACMLLLLERGQLELDQPVARYWPDFAQAGKAHVRVRDVVAHTTRLPVLEMPVTWEDATDPIRMAELLAAQPQSGDPRAVYSYNAFTFGWLCGELVRRVDGRSIGRFLADEVTGPLGLDVWIGLPQEQEPRVATLEAMSGFLDVPAPPDDAYARLMYTNPPRDTGDGLRENQRAWRAAEVAAANALGTARAMARFYDSLDRLLRPETLALGTRPISTRLDILFDWVVSFGVGFQLRTPAGELGPPPDAFGHGGVGGSLHGRWPTQRVGFSYAMNWLSADPEDPRGTCLLDALWACVEEGS